MVIMKDVTSALFDSLNIPDVYFLGLGILYLGLSDLWNQTFPIATLSLSSQW